ncbi:hypothetical protein RJ639_040598 [Escallonia herrerae]|uniref:DOG1 domain-containing protein n=1 Tax=Escallonia herrerae TaxID=1293975 RepID=A0AA89B4Y0_9ASTE|nr:hypothetical protein RJ639_040598 [Escallonia herrerae]
METTDHLREQRCYDEWISLPRLELSELRQALTLSSEGRMSDADLTRLVDKMMDHFQDYCDKRRCLAHQDPATYLTPNWCNALENSGLWVGPRRPSNFIRLVHALSGLDFESKLAEFLNGAEIEDLGGISGVQLSKISELQSKTNRQEEKLSSRMATLQENMADLPFARVANKPDQNCCLNEDAVAALKENGQAMASLVEEADRMRLDTVKELIKILTPVQAVQFLAASKKLLLCIKEWGERQDHEHGRNAE